MAETTQAKFLGFRQVGSPLVETTYAEETNETEVLIIARFIMPGRVEDEMRYFAKAIAGWRYELEAAWARITSEVEGVDG